MCHAITNILNSGSYTLNFVHYSDGEKAHQTSARYMDSEFEAVGFQEEFRADYVAPFVSQAVVKIAMKFEEKIDIKINGTVMIIGSIQEVILHQKLIGSDGFINLSDASVLVSCGLDAYFKSAPLGRFTYAKPDKWTVKI